VARAAVVQRWCKKLYLHKTLDFYLPDFKSSGVVYAFGGILMILGTILEWILGNTFTVVVFATFG
jgi:hypothetical protein